MVVHLPSLARALRLTFSREHFSIRFVLWTLASQTLWITLALLAWLGQALDLLLFPGFREAPLRQPLYIVSTPRSGSTFLHRILCGDEQFTHLKLYQTIFPAVIWYRFFAMLPALDRRIGRPFGRLLEAINRVFFSGWEGIHSIGFEHPEEDEAYWIYAWMTPAVVLFFPFLDKLSETIFPDRMPRPFRDRLAANLEANLRRHMYAVGHGKTLLAKNALAAGRFRCYLQAMPDLRLVHIVRHPYQSIASMISMFSAPWKLHSPHVFDDSEQFKVLGRMICDYYRTMLELKQELPERQFIELRYDDLVAAPRKSVESIYRHFGLELSDAFRKQLERESEQAEDYSSQHAYDLGHFGLSEAWIYEQMPEVFEHYAFKI